MNGLKLGLKKWPETSSTKALVLTLSLGRAACRAGNIITAPEFIDLAHVHSCWEEDEEVGKERISEAIDQEQVL
jgi:hypothetical protein